MKDDSRQLVYQIIEEIQQDATDEEVLHILLENKVSNNINSEQKEAYTLGQRAADKIAKFVGSWSFILIFLFILILWMAVNAALLSSPFDPFPFILLNLVLSCVAAIQAPLVMMSQNRQEQKDRMRSENDYKVNMKTEIVIEDLHMKVDALLKEQEKLYTHLQKMQRELAEKTEKEQ